MLTLVVFKVVNQTFSWGGSVWIPDDAGQPVPVLTVTLDADAKK